MVKAEDIMVKDVVTVRLETPIAIAIKVLVIRKISGLIVVDNEKKLLGVLSEKDLLGVLTSDEEVKDKVVADYMTEEVKSFSAEDSVDDINKFLIDQPFRRVPIVKEDKLVGIISRADIIAEIWKVRFNE
jgi:CBS domain-containing protein